MKVFVNSSITSRFQEIDLSPSDSIRCLKDKIYKLEKIEINDQALSYCSKPLFDSYSLRHYGIEEGATIELNARLRGGVSEKVRPSLLGEVDKGIIQKRRKTKSLDVKTLVRYMPQVDDVFNANIEELQAHYEKQKKKQIAEKDSKFAGYRSHAKAITAVAFANQEKWFATASEDGCLKFMDLENVFLRSDYPNHHKGKISSIAFSGNDAYLASGGEDMFIKIISTESRQVIRSVMNFYQSKKLDSEIAVNAIIGPILAIGFVENMDYCTVSTTQGAIFFDIDGGRFTEQINNIGVASSLVTTTEDKTAVRIVTNGSETVKSLKEFNKYIYGADNPSDATSVTISPNNKYICLGYRDGILKINDVNSLELIHDFGKVHAAAITAIVVSSDNKYIITGSVDCLLKVFDADIKQQIYVFTQSFDNAISALAVSQDSQHLLVGRVDKHFMLCPFKETLDIKEIPNSEDRYLRMLNVSKDGKYMISCSSGGDLRVFDVNTQQEVCKIEDAISQCGGAYITNDNRYVYLYYSNYIIKAFDIQEKKEIYSFEGLHDGYVSDFALSHNDKWLITSSEENIIKIIDVESKQIIHEFKAVHRNIQSLRDGAVICRGAVLTFAVTSDDKYIVSGSRDGSIKILDIQAREEVFEFFGIHSAKIKKILITSDNKLIVTASAYRSIKVIDFESRQIIKSFDNFNDYRLESIQFCHNERFVLSFGDSELIGMIHLETLQSVYSINSTNTNSTIHSRIQDAIVIQQKYLVTCNVNEPLKMIPLPYSDTSEIYVCSSRVSPYLKAQAYDVKISELKDVKARDEFLHENKDVYFLPHNWTFWHYFAIFKSESVWTLPPYQTIDMPFLLDRYKKTPLHYLIAHRKTDYPSVNYMLEYILDYIEHKPKISTYEQQSVLDSLSNLFPFIMTKANPSLINRFLKFCWRPAPTLHKQVLPRFGAPAEPCMFSSVPVLLPSTLEQLYEKDGHDNLAFRKLALKFDYEPSSDDMLSTALTLNHVMREDVFKSPAIANLINYLWQSSKKFHLFMGFFFSVLMLLISVYIGLGERSLGLEITITILSALFLISEFLQARFFGKSYFNQFWNLADIVFFLFVIASMILSFADYDDTLGRNWVFTVVLIAGYARWVSYLQLFGATRNLIHLILVVLKDMWAFILIVAFIIIGFALIFLEFDREPNYLDHVYDTYNLLYGGFDDSDYSPSQKLLLALILFVLSVVLLNLLISIMGDSYGKVQEASVITNARARLEMILESTILRRTFRQAKPANRGYLLYCKTREEVEEEEAEGEAWKEKADRLKNSIKQDDKRIEERVKNLEQKINKFKKSAEDRHNEVIAALQALSTK